MPELFATLSGDDCRRLVQLGRQTPNAVRQAIGRTQLRCPDCQGSAAIADVSVTAIAGYGTFGQCPLCAVGSPTGQWRPA